MEDVHMMFKSAAFCGLWQRLFLGHIKVDMCTGMVQYRLVDQGVLIVFISMITSSDCTVRVLHHWVVTGKGIFIVDRVTK